MAFLSEPAPPYDQAEDIAPGIRRMVARNPGPYTYHGTNSWIVAEPDGLTVIDPGPEDAAHTAALVALGPIARIVLTHTHPDHVGGAAALRQATGAAVHGWGTPWKQDFAPDIALEDGARAGSLTAIHTPGHASDHLCFAREGGVLFSGDQVMSWNTSIVSPPDGDMAAYMASLRLMLARADGLYLPGHGPALPDPLPLVRGMLMHRAGREAAVAGRLGALPVSPAAIVEALYGGIDPRLKPAAARTVLAHLLKLQAEGRAAAAEDGTWRAA